MDCISVIIIKTYGSKLQCQGGSGSGTPNGLKTHTCEYFTGTRASMNKSGITKEP